MADSKPSAASNLGTISSILGVLSVIIFLVAVASFGSKLGGTLYFATPVFALPAFVIGGVALLRARKQKLALAARQRAKIGLLTSLLVCLSWTGIYIWLLVFIMGMSNGMKFDHR